MASFADTNSVKHWTTHYASISCLHFEARTVADGSNGIATFWCDFLDGEIHTVEAAHTDAAIAAGTYSVRLHSELAESNVFDALLDGITHNTAQRTPFVTRVYGASSSGPWGRGLIVAGKHTFRVVFSTNVATSVRVDIWYVPAKRATP